MAVRRRLVEQTFPFRNVYTGVDRTRKRAVDESVISRLMRLDTGRSKSLEIARDLFMFSFYARGMAFVDMAYLRKSDIRDGIISYERRKTGQRLSVRLEPCMKSVVDRYADRARDTPYVFPILRSAVPEAAYRQYSVALNYYNRRLKVLSDMLGLEAGLSSYTSRHSWASVARNHHVPVSIISAGMGHASEQTTLIYLASLENSVIDDANRRVIALLSGAPVEVAVRRAVGALERERAYGTAPARSSRRGGFGSGFERLVVHLVAHATYAIPWHVLVVDRSSVRVEYEETSRQGGAVSVFIGVEMLLRAREPTVFVVGARQNAFAAHHYELFLVGYSPRAAVAAIGFLRISSANVVVVAGCFPSVGRVAALIQYIAGECQGAALQRGVCRAAIVSRYLELRGRLVGRRLHVVGKQMVGLRSAFAGILVI